MVPCQLAIGLTMFYGATWVDGALSGGVDAWPLARLFLFLYFLCATQDIAVDGWALTMLSEENVDMASVCNAIGQNIGWGVSFILFMALGDAETCNKYFRSTPSDIPIVTLGGFMNAFGWIFVTVTLLVWIFKRESRSFGPGEESVTVQESYLRLWKVCQLDSVKTLIVVLLTARFGFSGVDAISALKLQEFGVPKELMASMSAALMPIIGLIVPTVLGYIRGNGLDRWLTIYPVRLFACGIIICIVAYADQAQDMLRTSGVAGAFLVVIIGTSILNWLSSNVMFTAQMQFYCTLSDPAIGGSYM